MADDNGRARNALVAKLSQFAPLSDGKRFLVLENTGKSDPAQITLVTNWMAAMK